jgi:hydroxyethylthiazole kinase-like uncharacterized protein yjeF
MDAPPAISARESRVYEVNAVVRGIGVDLLMENAGRAVAEEAIRHLPPPPVGVGILIGSGNNGGDGTAAAHYLRQLGYAPEIFRVSSTEIRSAPARRCFDRAARDSPVHRGVPTAVQLSEYPLLIDALLGAGHTAPLRPEYAAAVGAMRQSGTPVLAIDTPTGLGDPGGLLARWTVALTAPKSEVPAARAGEVIVRDIGIPAAAWSETGPGDFLTFEAGPPDPVPARGGRIVVVGGGPFAGAPALVGLAALRAGAERATVLVPEQIAPVVQGFSLDLVVRGIGGTRWGPESVARAWAVLESGPVDAVVAGPGAGRDEATLTFFRELLPSLDLAVPIVVDADALPALWDETGTPLLPGRPVIATPNEGEFARMVKTLPGLPSGGTPDAAARAISERLGVTLVCKGAADRIVNSDRSARNLHHPPSQAVAGSGDVLAGVLGALLARGGTPWDAARLGTYWVGEAGHRVAAVRGPGLLASDLVDAVAATGRAGLERVRSLGSG